MSSFTYENFIKATETLLECYSKVLPSDYEKMEKAQQSQLCIKEKEYVKQFFMQGDLRFSNILKERKDYLK